MDFLTALVARNGYLPHGYCFVWTPGLLWTMVAADAIIALAYFSIPVALVSFVRKRRDLSMGWLIWLFSAFIFSCGITHVMDIWTIWQPDYGLQALTKVVTAAVSLATAVALWPLIPRAVKIPSFMQMKSVIVSLEAEASKRHSAEQHLRETQQGLALTLASIGAGFIATDRDGRVTRMNAVAEQIMGWTQSEAQGQSFWTVFNREDRPADYVTTNVVDLVIQQGITVDIANHVIAISRDGTRTALEVKAAVTKLDDASLSGMAMVFRDMSPLIKAEVESNRLAAIVESSNDAIIGKTLDGRITSWNRAAEAIFGYTAEEAIGQPIQMLLPAGGESEEMRILAELARGAKVPAFDALRLSKNGNVLHVSVTISPIRDATGRIIGASKIARDVSQQRRAEAALRGSEARLRFTLDAAQIGDWDLDLNKNLIRGSLQFARCFGYEYPQPDWTFDTLIQHIHPEDRGMVGDSFAVSLALMTDLRLECRVIWPDPGLHWISLHGNFEAETEKPGRMLGIVTETTKQRLAEDARLKAQRLEAENRQILEANRLKSQFLANMSHELRTPLNAIIGFARLLESGAVPASSANYQKFLGNIGSSGRHLLKLINDVLDLSKVESGTFEFYAAPLDLQATVSEVADTLHPAMESKNMSIDMQVDGALTDIHLDVSRLKQVLYNLLSNAVKFTPAGGLVTVRAFAQGPDHFRLEVQDNGIGIAPDDLPRLFVEFQQLDVGYSKKHEGTGLGLALTRRLVEAQGGTVGVASTLALGSVFHVVLNRIHDTDTIRRIRAAEAGAVQGAVDRILVIEDDPSAQSRLEDGFSLAGYRVDGASTGNQALRYAHETAYDGISLDLVLQDQRGLAVLAGIRQDGASRDAPVVGLSMPTESGGAAGFAIANVLCKPLRGGEVLGFIAPLARSLDRRARVLVIDDDPMALDLMHVTLANIRVDASCVADGRSALRDIAKHQPDAIVLDLMMPEFDGFEVLDALRRMPQWLETPVYIWTSMILTNDEYMRLSRSATAIVNKGGGGMGSVVEGVRRWHPAAVADLSRSAS
jgi:PAS domain S-box-containing protein